MKKQRNKINNKEIKFCNYYLNDFFYSGGTSYIKAYMEAFDIKNITWRDKEYRTIQNKVSRIINKEYVKKYLEEHINLIGLNDQYVNIKLLDIISKGNNTVCLNAIKLYKQIKGELNENNITINNNEVDLSKLTDDELIKYLDITKKINK